MGEGFVGVMEVREMWDDFLDSSNTKVDSHGFLWKKLWVFVSVEYADVKGIGNQAEV